MLAVAEPLARPKSEYFNRPLRDGRVFLLHFPALRTGLLSNVPCGTIPLRIPRDLGLMRIGLGSQGRFMPEFRTLRPTPLFSWRAAWAEAYREPYHGSTEP
jgi:hypothetical protein